MGVAKFMGTAGGLSIWAIMSLTRDESPRAGTPFQRLQLNLKNAVLSRSPPSHWALSTST